MGLVTFNKKVHSNLHEIYKSGYHHQGHPGTLLVTFKIVSKYFAMDVV